jgi:carbon storage regulator
MLVLNRTKGQSIKIGNNIKVVLVRCKNGTARIGIEAPSDVQILRDDAAKQTPPAAEDVCDE